MTKPFLKHDEFCPCTRFHTQEEFCTCGAVEVNKDLGDIVESFGRRVREIRKTPARNTKGQTDE
jgi:hypothetical protein